MAETDRINTDSKKNDLKQSSIETVKGLAPWRVNLPWWIVLVEGIVLGLVGILILIDPRKSTINIALFLAAAMFVAGILQLWAVLRGKAPESVDALISARGAVAVFAGSMVLLLKFLDYLNLESGLLIFGLGSFIFGVAGLVVAFRSKRSRRVSSFVEGFFYALFGILLLYILIVGDEGAKQVQSLTQVIAWVAVVGGLVLFILSFFSRSRQSPDRKEPESLGSERMESDHEKSESVLGTSARYDSVIANPATEVTPTETTTETSIASPKESATDEDKPKSVL